MREKKEKKKGLKELEKDEEVIVEHVKKGN